jgi:hypothetical protein
MDPFCQICTCGRTFTHLGAFKNHQNKCRRNKSHLSIVLAKAKAVFTAKKPPQLRHARTEQPRSREVVPLIEADEEEVLSFLIISDTVLMDSFLGDGIQQ